MDLDDFAKNYIILGLRINKHIDGYVEHYYGPSDLKTIVDTEKILSPNQLLKDCLVLKNQLTNQGFEAKRQKFLLKNIEAMETIIRKITGEKVPYLEQVERLFDFKPVLYKDEFFYNLKEKAEELYKGNGKLSDRIELYSKKRMIPPNKIKTNFIKTLDIVQEQTNNLFQELLPSQEKVIISEVTNKSWPMYCWYQGNYISKIEINIEKVHYWTHLLHTVCHEAYPGHHTERTLKERYLFRNKGYFETSILIIYTPEIVISEGMGILAERVLFNPTESIQILLEKVLNNKKIEDSLEDLIGQSEIREGFRRFESNLAYYKYVYNWNEEELTKYARNFRVIPDVGIKAMLEFITDKIWAPYILVYQGERLITEKFGNKPSPKEFQKLLTEQILPSDL